jgi:hypothetical protein
MEWNKRALDRSRVLQHFIGNRNKNFHNVINTLSIFFLDHFLYTLNLKIYNESVKESERSVNDRGDSMKQRTLKRVYPL